MYVLVYELAVRTTVQSFEALFWVEKLGEKEKVTAEKHISQYK